MVEVGQNFKNQIQTSNEPYVKKNYSKTFGTIRKYFNQAVYLETPLVAPSRRSSTPSLRATDEGPRIVKKCVCFTNPKSCIHSSSSTESIKSVQPGLTSKSLATIKFSPSSSQEMLIRPEETKLTRNLSTSDIPNNQFNQFTLQITPAESNKRTSRYINGKKDKDSFQMWLANKEKEKKKREQAEARLKEYQEKEKEMRLQEERENFMKWLENKKKQEEKKKEETEKKKREQSVKSKIKEIRSTESELRYQLWLKRKQQAELDKKIKEQEKLMKMTEEKEKRLSLNAKAYQDWVNRSRYKAKPLPLNKGIDSLKTSVSVTYINPNPWNGI